MATTPPTPTDNDGAAGTGTPIRHPLDPLTPGEFRTVAAIVRAEITTGFKLVPNGFFDRNPTLDLPAGKNASSCHVRPVG